MNSEAESGLVLMIYQAVESPDQLDSVLAALADLTGAESARLVRTGDNEHRVLATGRAKSWSGKAGGEASPAMEGEVGVRILPLFGDYELVLDRSDPSPERLAHLVRLAPHLTRALRLAERLEANRDGLSLGKQSLDRLPFGVALLDREKRVLLLNRAAGTLTRPGAPLDLREHRLIPRAAVARVMFDTLLERTVRPGRPGPRRHSGGQVTLPMRGQVGAELIVAPLRAPTERGLCACAVLMFSPRLAVPDPETLFEQAHGLSAEEARTAARLLAGRTPGDDEKLGNAEGEARLLAILEKLGTTRQNDLLSLVLGAQNQDSAVDPTPSD